MNGYPDKDWDLEDLSGHPNLTIEWISCFPNQVWNFDIILEHPNFTIEWISYITEKFPLKQLKVLNTNRIKAQFLFMTENPETESCLHKEIIENVWSPKNVLRYDGKYAERTFVRMII